VHERLGIAGSGAIACGLAASAARHGEEVVLWARSDGSARRGVYVDSGVPRPAHSSARGLPVGDETSALTR
jgi:3-hydroxybutyryl-CoA dehydrogenase